ncbi:replication initiation factor domain-containing protein [Streptococcus devriesei]|uniref:replication initiation factor domain-containing protein n=1 Tax=Streptococcus devriesei TaxID=231233 RepID=UPI0004274BF9|nr:replication initiation factor domain-containing protein [Streptococcus devriesei]
MIDIKVDQVTLVVFDNNSQHEHTFWQERAQKNIQKLLHLSKLSELYSFTDENVKLPRGYTVGFNIDNATFQLSIAYHPDNLQIGIIIYFSAKAWDNYQQAFQEKFGKSINVHTLLQELQFSSLNIRLSRIDICVDFINEKINISKLKRSLESGRTELRYGKYKNSNKINLQHIQEDNLKKPYPRNTSQINDISKDFKTETIYLGSRSKNSKAIVRIYDKKRELQERNIDKNVEDWVRFEVEFKEKFAHQLTLALLDCQSDNEAKNIILSAVLDKYLFFYTKSNRLHKISKLMLEQLESGAFSFTTSKITDNSLEKSIQYLIRGSGLLALLWKVDQIYGQRSSPKLLGHFYQIYKNTFKPNKDHLSWLNKYQHELKGTKEPWI